MIPTSRRLPAALILEVSVITVRCMNGAQSSKHGNVLFIDCTNSSVILLTILFITSDQRARGHKVSFGCDDLCFFPGCCIERTRTDPCYLVIFFLPMSPKFSSCFGMISDEGGGAIVAMLSYDRGRLHVFFSAA
jgi:hypothetical protein